LVILCSYNPETGSRVFQPNQRELVLNRSAAAVEQIATVAMNLSGLGAEAVEAAKKVSTETLSDSSSSN
jgi:predicted transcriptional regulator